MNHLVGRVSFRDFLRYIRNELKFSFEMEHLKDSREAPQIPTIMVAQAVAIGAVFGMESVLQMDGMTQLPGIQRELKIKRKKISDTTISRVAGKILPSSVDRVMSGLSRRIRSGGMRGVRLGVGRKRAGGVDGSQMGGRLMSVLAEQGKAPGYLGMERIPKRGKELPVSLELIGKTAKREGKNFLDLILGDGLYAAKNFWKTCKEAGTRGVVKTKNEKLDVIKRAKIILREKKGTPRVEFEEGIDLRRGYHWRIEAVNGLAWGVRQDGPMLKVARVWTKSLKGPRKGKVEVFWILSEDQSLDTWSLRELGHERWFIENEVFRAFNEQTHSKHQFSHDSRTALVLSKLQALGMMLIAAYLCHLERFRKRLRGLWDHGKLSLKLLRLCLTASLSSPVRADTG